MQAREKVEKSRLSRFATAEGADPFGQMRDEKNTPLWREARFQVNMHKHGRFAAFLAVVIWKKCTLECGKAHLEVKSVEN